MFTPRSIKHYKHLVIVLTALLFAFSAPSFAAGKNVFKRHIPDKKTVMQKAANINSEKYPNADTVLIHREEFIRYDRHGLYDQWDDRYIKILNETGKMDYKNISESFTIPYNTTEFTLAEIIKPNGKTVPISIRENAKTMTEHSQMSANIYNPNSRVLRLNIPGLEVGDVLHCVSHARFDKTRVPGTFSSMMTFERLDPIIFSRNTIIAPQELPLKKISVRNRVGNTLDFAQEKKADKIRYQWRAKNVPRAYPEPDMPPFYKVAQRVLASTITDWQWLSKWYWDLCEPNLNKTSPEMRAKVRELTSGLDSAPQKITTLFNWVSQKIRYLGLTLEKNAPGYEPHPVDMTFRDRAGVCRDKAALLAAMLRLAGFEAYPVLIMNGPKRDPEVPMPFFNHAITAVKKPDGSFLLMDSTDESTARLFPAYLSNQSYLVATPEGEPLRTSPVIPAEENMLLISTNATLASDGNVRARTKFLFKGVNDNIYRGLFARQKKRERKRFLESRIRKKMPSAIIKNCRIQPANMLDVSKPLTAELKYLLPDYTLKTEQSEILNLPRLASSLGAVRFVLDSTRLKERKYPLFSRLTCGVKENISLSLPQDLQGKIHPPEDQNASAPGIEWANEYALDDQAIKFEKILKIKKPEFSPAEYKGLINVLAKMETAGNKKIIAEGKTQKNQEAEWYAKYSPDTVVLNRSTHIHIHDTHNWTETQTVSRKILTYAGKKDKSELKISFNPAWEQVEIKDVRVISRDGRVTEIDDSRINIMDAEWAGKAPRYPAGKIMVVNFPAVGAGSVIKYTTVKKKTNRPCFNLCAILRDSEPIRSQEIIINAPRDMHIDLNYSETGFGLDNKWWRIPENKGGIEVHPRGERTEHRIEKSFTAPLPREKDIPPLFTFCPTLAGSTTSWDELGKRFEQAALSRLNKPAGEKLQALAERFKDIKDRDRRIQAIRDHIAENIGLAGPKSFDIPLSELSAPRGTIQDGYGNSADRALLTYKLLALSGFDPDLVLESKFPGAAGIFEVQRLSPSLNWFDKVLVRIKNSKGEHIFLNGADQYARLGTTPGNGKTAFYPSSAEISRIKSPNFDLKTSKDTQYDIRLHDNGDARIKIEMTYRGMNYAELNKKMNVFSSEKINQYIQKKISGFNRAAELLGDYEVEFDSYPGRESFEVFVPELAEVEKGTMILDIPGLIEKIKGAGTNSRKLPLLREGFHRQKITVNIVLPDGFQVQSMPSKHTAFMIPGSGPIVMTALKAKENRVQITQEANLRPVIISPCDYQTFLQVQNELARPKNNLLILKHVD